eukprot:2065779-Amphidinium_carterae.1
MAPQPNTAPVPPVVLDASTRLDSGLQQTCRPNNQCKDNQIYVVLALLLFSGESIMGDSCGWRTAWVGRFSCTSKVGTVQPPL